MSDRPAAANPPYEAAAIRPTPPIGIYIHFPWCLSKCRYCDFTSTPCASPSAIPERLYADRIAAEFRARVRSLPPHTLASVYIGGGTPSLWSVEHIARLVDTLQSSWDSRAERVEVTLECNPSSLQPQQCRDLRAAGVSRISLGIQSLDDEVLRWLGRRHTHKEALLALERAQAAGFEDTGVDLLLAIPGHSLRGEISDARRLAALGITHLSAYVLTFEEGTELGRRVKEGLVQPCSDSRVARTLGAFDAALTQLGFEHYEISNYARPGYRSRHNQGYWQGHEYLGLGVGATGTIGSGPSVLRYRNPLVLDEYLAVNFDAREWSVASSGHAAPGMLEEALSPDVRLTERIMLGLRTSAGLDLGRIGEELGLLPLSVARKAVIARLLQEGRLVEADGVLRIPSCLWHLSDGIIRDLI